MIDGLDSIFLNDEKYDESLSSLIQAAYELNQNLRTAQATGNIVLLLRNDVFARIALSLPDSQKMRDDYSFELDWRILSGNAGIKAPLVRLVNAKAARALEIDDVDVLSYFPNKIKLGQRGRQRMMDKLQYLLNLTRHTPRDLLRLFEEVRKVEASGIYPSKGNTLSNEVIREGVIQYSTKYFVGAIANEFAGYEGGPESAASAISALKTLDSQVFGRETFAQALENVGGAPLNTDRLLHLLFFAGAIGNYVIRRDRESYMRFYHRRDDSEIYLRGNFILHGALAHAWGIPHAN